jgi:hypothetical protein
MRTHWLHFLSVAALTLAIAQSIALADRFNIEDPSQYPGVWYRVDFDNTGNMTSGTGDGQGWYYYPASGAYRMWWDNGAYDTARAGRLNYEVYAEAIDPDLMTHASIRFIWTSAQWSQSGHSDLPYPADVPTTEEEDAAISSASLMTIDYYLGDVTSSEANRTCVIRDYNPAWVGIEITGRNLHVCRGAWHECVPKDDGGGAIPSLGAWCDRSTGACYIGTIDEGLPPYEWLGAGSSCADCPRPTEASLDFGDAPDPTYPTVLAHNGARHTIVRELFLGRGVDGEADGQPNANADGDGNDDDGVSFTSVLQPGMAASLEVTASARGYLNAWIDFDQDGSFAGRSEQIFADELLTGGINRLTFTVPAEAVPGATYARFRFNSRGLLSYDGPASDGEVEDYRVQIATSYEPHATSGLTAVLWSQLPAGPSAVDPYSFEPGSEPSALHLRQIAADDWQTSDGRPVTGIHWWGVFDGWTESYLPAEMPLAFHLGIWTNMPNSASAKDTFAHPDTLIWEKYCTNWTWALAGFERGNRDELGKTCFQFTCSLSQDQWFEANRAGSAKSGAEPTTYWLSITAVYDPQITQPAHLWAWKTRPGGSTAAAVSIQTLAPSPSASSWPPAAGAQWQEGQPLEDQASQPLDMAFQLTTYGPAEYGSPAPGQPKIGAATGLDDLPRLAARWLADAR